MLKIVDGATDGYVIDDLLFVGSRGNERCSAEEVNTSGRTKGVVGNATKGIVGKDGDAVTEASDFKMMLDVSESGLNGPSNGPLVIRARVGLWR